MLEQHVREPLLPLLLLLHAPTSPTGSTTTHADVVRFIDLLSLSTASSAQRLNGDVKASKVREQGFPSVWLDAQVLAGRDCGPTQSAPRGPTAVQLSRLVAVVMPVRPAPEVPAIPVKVGRMAFVDDRG